MIGYYNEDPIINPDEVEDWKWMGIDAVKENMVLFQSSIQFGLKSF
jgi:isopentenyl-diphosphate delta-isomerase